MKRIHKSVKEYLEKLDKWAALYSTLPDAAKRLVANNEPKDLSADYSSRMADHDAFDHMRTKMEISKYKTPENKVFLYTFGRDCDMCESDYVIELDADYEQIKKAIDSIYESAEGYTIVHLITKTQADEFKPSFRDRAMEAFENGHGANAYSV